MARTTASSGLGSSGCMSSLTAWLTVSARRRTIGRAVDEIKQRCGTNWSHPAIKDVSLHAATVPVVRSAINTELS